MSKSNVAIYLIPVFGVACLLGLSCKPPPPPEEPAPEELQPFPPGDPQAWTCGEEEVSAAQIESWCSEHKDRGKPSTLPLPASISDPAAKNQYDEQLRSFLTKGEYETLGWVADKRWRLTGPYVGPFGGGKSYGVHPAVRIWYSPEVVDWMCEGREGELPDGAMIVKEMHPIKPQELGINPNLECMRIDEEPDDIEPDSWTVMVRSTKASADGWYWANPTTTLAGNPPILDRSAVLSEKFFGDHQRNEAWYPTGDLFGDYDTLPSAVTPYSDFGAYCVNCHASAESMSTFSSLENVVGEGLRYRHFAALDPEHAADTRTSGAEHSEVAKHTSSKPSWGLSAPLEAPAKGWGGFFGHLGPTQFRDALELRLPAETYDHQVAAAGDDPGTFLTSDQCIGCHDATVSNDSTPNMLLFDFDSGEEINISPYAEWRASPMGLAGRDPIFFAQLQSETNNLSKLSACIENTCLHCHGVMGQRTFAAETGPDSDECKDLFGVEPPPEVPFGKPFRLKQVTQWGGEGGDPKQARYGALARDGISCTVCHHVSEQNLGDESGYTGNFLTLPGNEIVGPYKDDEITTKPMEHALGVTPKYGEQIKSSALCGSCHNILLPVLDNEGQPINLGTKKKPLFFSYEQTTDLEWQNSAYAKDGHNFRSCQDCHMQTFYTTSDNIQEEITDIQIANIESDLFAPTTHRLPDEDITLTDRETYSRHTLHGLNIFQNQLAQQFPLLLGLRQIDFMGSTQPSTRPALVTAANSIVEMAQTQTASAEIMSQNIDPDTGMVDVTVMVRNLAGHYLPSGVGFRRSFVELTVRGKNNKLLWASGRTNELGIILDGTTGEPLETESGARDATAFQPHHELISSGDQVQIYQELVLDSEGHLTTSFLRRAEVVKDNRLRPRGYDPAFYANHESPYVQLIAHEHEELPSYEDPYYTDPQLTGGDMVMYQIQLTPEQAKQITKITVQLYNQSIPPSYLQQRFEDAKVGPAENSEIRRLYYMTSHLRADASTPIRSWKLLLARDCKTEISEPCDIEGELPDDI